MLLDLIGVGWDGGSGPAAHHLLGDLLSRPVRGQDQPNRFLMERGHDISFVRASMRGSHQPVSQTVRPQKPVVRYVREQGF
ncbi:hypothetical protein AHiyo1_19090 [Arthrobacter sp. Hiyo1]|nr:hypothetical protein AHiyo1_19090 [Arthrobacter sp. Hiyo1]